MTPQTPQTTKTQRLLRYSCSTSALRRRAGFGRCYIICTQATTHWQVLMETERTPKLCSLKFLTDSQILLFSDYSKTNNILEFLIIHCLINTALMKTLHQLYIPCPPTTPTAQAGADKVLIQCLQSVYLELQLYVPHENLHHLYIPRPPTTPRQGLTRC